MSATHGSSERLLHYALHRMAYHGFTHHRHRYQDYHTSGPLGWMFRVLAFLSALPMLALAFAASGLLFYIAAHLFGDAAGIWILE